MRFRPCNYIVTIEPGLEFSELKPGIKKTEFWGECIMNKKPGKNRLNVKIHYIGTNTNNK